MDMASKKQYLDCLQEQYFKVNKQGKTDILDQFVKDTGHNRKYVIRQLNNKALLSQPQKNKRSRRKRYYDEAVVSVLKFLYTLFDYPCGQRLKPLINVELERLRQFGEVNITNQIAQKLQKISSVTIDRKLKDYKAKTGTGNRFSMTKSGSLLKRMIPIRLTEWDTSETGYLEADTVAHCGGNASGSFISSLSLVEISSGWWEGEGLKTKGQKETLEGLINMRKRTPFIWKGIDSDNGSEFINHHLYPYCQKENIYFTRSRPNKKNDNAYIEQKNWTHVRKVLGYGRYETNQEYDLINDLYRNELRLFKNYFQPIIKLKSKIRVGSIKHRRYEVAKTPYQRILESKQVSKEIKQQLKSIYSPLNPAKLKRDLDKKLQVLYDIQTLKERK